MGFFRWFFWVSFFRWVFIANPDIRMILRLQGGTHHKLVAGQQLPPPAAEQPSPIALARLIVPDISIQALQPVLCPRASDLLLNYDE